MLLISLQIHAFACNPEHGVSKRQNCAPADPARTVPRASRFLPARLRFTSPDALIAPLRLIAAASSRALGADGRTTVWRCASRMPAAAAATRGEPAPRRVSGRLQISASGSAGARAGGVVPGSHLMAAPPAGVHIAAVASLSRLVWPCRAALPACANPALAKRIDNCGAQQQSGEQHASLFGACTHKN